MDHDRDQYVISMIKGLIDPQSENYMAERHPMIGGRSTSTWATLEQIDKAVKSLGHNISLRELESICYKCTCYPKYGYSGEQFAERFNKKYNK